MYFLRNLLFFKKFFIDSISDSMFFGVFCVVFDTPVFWLVFNGFGVFIFGGFAF